MTRALWLGGAILALGWTALGLGTAWGSLGGAFWQSVASNLAATLTGLVVGVPIALAINRQQQAAADSVAKQQREHDAESAARSHRAKELEREVRFLGRLLADVDSSKELAEGWHKEFSSAEPGLLQAGFATEKWEVLKECGELSAVKDLYLLELAADWHDVRLHFNRLHSLCLTAVMSGPGIAQEQAERRILASMGVTLEVLMGMNDGVAEAVKERINAARAELVTSSDTTPKG